MLKYILAVGFCMHACNLPAAPARVVTDEADNAAIVEGIYSLCGAELGPVAEKTVKQHVTEVLPMFLRREDRISFTILVCIESKFHSGARSTAGAVGLTQVMPRYAESFAKDCYLATRPLDLWVPEVNLRTGACQYRKLLTQYPGRYTMALAAYNAGAESPTVKRMRKHERINQETAEYSSRYWNLREAFHEYETRENGPSVADGTLPIFSGGK